jgi:hypothetical protein
VVWLAKVRAAIVTRMREKMLLMHVLTLVDQLEARGSDNTTAVTYQVTPAHPLNV